MVERERAMDAVDVLNDIIGDLVAGTNVFRDYRERFRAGDFAAIQMSAVQQMCFSYLALTLTKILEFWDRYRDTVPKELAAELKNLNKIIRERGAKDFRNKVAGHIWDTKLRRPLRHSEIMEMLETLLGTHADEFLNWVNDSHDENVYPNTILSIIEHIRDSIARDHNIQPSEILDR